jgi:FlaA1/EpsC-like NDP-sugar epimerase
MFRERAKLFNRLQFLTDILLTCAAFPLAYWSRIHLANALPPHLDTLLNPELHPINAYFWSMGLSVICWAAAATSLGLYRITIRRSGWEKVRIVIESSILLGLFLGFLSFALKLDLSRPLIALFGLYQALMLVMVRWLVHLHTKRKQLRFPSKHIRNIVIVGTSPKARKMGALVSRYSDWGLRILGYVDVKDTEKVKPEGDILGSVADLPEIIENNVVDEILFVGDRPSLDVLDKVLELCSEQGIRTRVAADFFPAKVTNLSMEFVENVPFITFSSAPEHAPSLVAGDADFLAGRHLG